jgi:hypothetical protein
LRIPRAGWRQAHVAHRTLLRKYARAFTPPAASAAATCCWGELAWGAACGAQTAGRPGGVAVSTHITPRAGGG